MDSRLKAGEGMFMPLGAYFNQSRHDDIQDRLSHLHQIFFQQAEEGSEATREDWLIKIEFDSAFALLSDDKASLSAKKELVKNLEHNLWTAPDHIIEERMKLFELAMYDKNPEVASRVFWGFALGARLTPGVKLIKDYVQKTKDEGCPFELHAEIAQAATCLLYESHCYHKDLKVLLQDFGTSSISKIHEKSGGIISPEQFSSIRKIANRAKYRRWNSDHHNDLRQILAYLLDEFSYNPVVVQQCERGLKDYVGI